MCKLSAFALLGFLLGTAVAQHVRLFELNHPKSSDNVEDVICNSGKSWKELNLSEKICRYRNQLYPQSQWNRVTGFYCYFYSHWLWFSEPIGRYFSKQEIVDGISFWIPYGLTDDNVTIDYDYHDSISVKYIERSFKTRAYFDKWKSCAVNAEACCENDLNEDNVCPSKEFPCYATWDARSCFAPAKNGTISELPCPEYTRSSDDTPCILYSQKECFANGTWNMITNYATCDVAPVYKRRHEFHIIILYISIALSFPAIVIFSMYRRLRILRVNLHRNLLIACLLYNIFTVISKEVIIMDSLQNEENTNDVLHNNGIACRFLAFITNISANAIYVTMFMDAFYLHKLIVRIFSADPNPVIMYVATIVLSILPTVVWAIFVGINSNEFCWMVDTSWYQWITDGFRIALLGINIILLLDIIKGLVMKLRKNITAQHTKYIYVLVPNGISYETMLRRAYTSTLKAMLFLLPLFGVPFIITANRNIVDKDSCLAGDIYYYISYSIQGLQGVMVAIVFCYFNKEVHNEIKNSFRKINARYGLFKTTAPQRRDTAATYVANNNSVAPRPSGAVVPGLDSDKDVVNWLAHVTESEGETNNKSRVPDQDELNSKALSARISKFIDESNENITTLNADKEHLTKY